MGSGEQTALPAHLSLRSGILNAAVLGQSRLGKTTSVWLYGNIPPGKKWKSVLEEGVSPFSPSWLSLSHPSAILLPVLLTPQFPCCSLMKVFLLPGASESLCVPDTPFKRLAYPACIHLKEYMVSSEG